MPTTTPSAIAFTYLEAGHYSQALQALERIADCDRTPEDWVNHAVCLIHLEQPDAALVVCDRALAFHPHHPQTWLFKGVALQRLHRYQDAYACYDQAAEHESGHDGQRGQSVWQRPWAALRSSAKQLLHADEAQRMPRP